MENLSMLELAALLRLVGKQTIAGTSEKDYELVYLAHKKLKAEYNNRVENGE